MAIRYNIFCIHSWAEVASYQAMVALLAEQESGLADYSIPPWKAVPGEPEDVEASIRARLSLASAVIVLNTPQLHLRTVSSLEMRLAAEMNKRIVVLQPRENFWQSLPSALDGMVYRVCSWRSGVLGRAIRGEYPRDSRVFDLSELAEQRAVVAVIASMAVAGSLFVIVRDLSAIRTLETELALHGINLDWGSAVGSEAFKYGLTGALLLGGAALLLTRDPKTALWAAAAGGLGGAAYGVHRTYRAFLNTCPGGLQCLTLDPA
jgi:hypothetical protein